MKPELLVQLLVTVVVAVAGWLVAHRFTSARDQAAKRRELRLKYLVEAFRTIERSVGTTLNPQSLQDLQSAVTDVQLLGSVEQAKRARNFAATFGTSGLNVSPLLNDLRESIRAELGLSADREEIVHMRPTLKSTSP